MYTRELTPFSRSSFGFDLLLDQIDCDTHTNGLPSYPSYNIEKISEDAYCLTMAVAGFSQDELDIEIEENQLTVTGRKASDNETDRQYLHHGISRREFERRFNLENYVQVHGAHLRHGLLQIDLKRELPEVMKPRTINIVVDEKKAIKRNFT